MQFRFNYLFQNGYISLTRPPIEILSPLFTLQLLILPTRDPFRGQKRQTNKEKRQFSKIWPGSHQGQGEGHYFKFVTISHRSVAHSYPTCNNILTFRKFSKFSKISKISKIFQIFQKI